MHGNLYGTVVGVDGSGVVWAAGWVERLSGSEQGFDGFVAKHHEGGHCAKAGRECVVPASVGDPLNDLFAAEFFEIVGSVAGAYGRGPCSLKRRTLAARSEAVKPLAEGDKAMSASTTWRMRALLRSMPPRRVLPTREASGRRSSISSAMKH